MAVRQTSCRNCGQDIENFSPYRAGEWRDRGNNTTCPNAAGDAGQKHAPVIERWRQHKSIGRSLGESFARDEREMAARNRATDPYRKYSPFPWKRGTGFDVNKVLDADGVVVCDGSDHGSGVIADNRRKWNVRLLAASGDLLMACERAERVFRNQASSPDDEIAALEALRAAITKAKGSF
jgi:hypothetical protein